MPTENEQRFLLRKKKYKEYMETNMFEAMVSKQKIVQFYLVNTKKVHVRVRIYEDPSSGDRTAEITCKYFITPTARFEINEAISLSSARYLMKRAKKIVEKERTTIITNDGDYIVDYFPKKGISIVEVEYKEVPKKILDFCGKNINGVKKYSNLALATKNKDYVKNKSIRPEKIQRVQF